MFLFFYSSLAIIIETEVIWLRKERHEEIQRRKEPYSKPNFIISN